MSTIMGLRRTLVGVVTTTGLVSSTLLGSPSACADEPPPTQCARGLNEADLDRLDAATDMLTPRDSLPSLRDAQRLATGRGVTVAVIDTGVNRNGDLPTLAPGEIFSVTPTAPRIATSTEQSSPPLLLVMAKPAASHQMHG